MNVESFLPSAPGWRQVLVKFDGQDTLFRVDPVSAWAVQGEGHATPLGPDGKINSEYHLLELVSPLCEDSTDTLLERARGLLFH